MSSLPTASSEPAFADPVNDPTAAWHLATAHAYRHTASLFPASREHLLPMAESAEANFRAAHGAPFEATGLTAAFLPEARLGLPAVCWSAAPNKPGQAAGRSKRFGELFPVTPVARDATFLPILEPRHGALAALAQILDRVERGLAACPPQFTSDRAWQRVKLIGACLRSAAQTEMGRLPSDHFIGWLKPLRTHTDLAGAVIFVGQVAATSAAQQAVATSIIASWLQEILDQASHAPRMSERLLCVGTEVAAELNAFVAERDAAATDLARRARLHTQGHAPFHVLRPVGIGHPIVVWSQPEEAAPDAGISVDQRAAA